MLAWATGIKAPPSSSDMKGNKILILKKGKIGWLVYEIGLLFLHYSKFRNQSMTPHAKSSGHLMSHWRTTTPQSANKHASHHITLNQQGTGTQPKHTNMLWKHKDENRILRKEWDKTIHSENSWLRVKYIHTPRGTIHRDIHTYIYLFEMNCSPYPKSVAKAYGPPCHKSLSVLTRNQSLTLSIWKC